MLKLKSQSLVPEVKICNYYFISKTQELLDKRLENLSISNSTDLKKIHCHLACTSFP